MILPVDITALKQELSWIAGTDEDKLVHVDYVFRCIDRHTKKSQGVYLDQALNEGDGVYRS